jgi:hypothetical protein
MRFSAIVARVQTHAAKVSIDGLQACGRGRPGLAMQHPDAFRLVEIDTYSLQSHIIVTFLYLVLCKLVVPSMHPASLLGQAAARQDADAISENTTESDSLSS